jgi:hypothetical protein
MVKRDDKRIETTRGSVRDTGGKPAEPGRKHETGDAADLHEAHYRPEMGRIVPTDDRLKHEGR